MSKPRWQHIDYHVYDPNAPSEHHIISIDEDVMIAVSKFLDKYPGSPFKIIEHGFRFIPPLPIQLNLKERN